MGIKDWFISHKILDILDEPDLQEKIQAVAEVLRKKLNEQFGAGRSKELRAAFVQYAIFPAAAEALKDAQETLEELAEDAFGVVGRSGRPDGEVEQKDGQTDRRGRIPRPR